MKPLISTALAGLLSIAMSCQASALMYNQSRSQEAGHWTSLQLSLGEESYFRATNQNDYPDTSFSVTFVPDDCRPQLELRVDMGEIAARDETVRDTPGALRVDRLPLHASEVTLTRERGDSGAYASFQTSEAYRLLHEMRNGEILRMEIGDDEPWYLAFHLAGVGSALDRAAAMCHEAKEPAAEDDQDSEPKEFF